MRKLLRDKLGRFRSIRINLLDGQRRGEVMFRRVFLLVVLYALVVLLAKTLTNKTQEVEVKEVEAKEHVIKNTKVIGNGETVYYDGDGRKWYVYEDYDLPEEEKEVKEERVDIVVGKGDTVGAFIKSYGGKINGRYLELLREECSSEALKVVVAISVAETSMGKNTSKETNFYGWHKGGNRDYDPSVEEMAKEICRGVEKSYMQLGENTAITSTYTGNDRVGSWTKNFNWAMDQM